MYAINSKSVKKYIEPRTSIYPFKVVVPMINDSIPHQVGDCFMGFPNATRVLLHYFPQTHKMKRICHAYVDKNNIRIHPKDHLKPGSLLIREYPTVYYTPYLPTLHVTNLEKSHNIPSTPTRS